MTEVYYISECLGNINESDAARRLLVYVLEQYRGITDARFSKHPTGKPYLENYSDIHISITHTDDCVACAVSDDPVGVDAQIVGDTKPRIAMHMFTENERDYVKDDAVRFFEVWTKKESFVKLAGEGLTKRVSETDVISGESARNYTFETVVLIDHVISVCHMDTDPTVFQKISFSEIDI